MDAPVVEPGQTDMLEVEVSPMPQYHPGLVKPGEPSDQPTAYRLQHGDLHTIPGVFGTFNDENGNMNHDKRHEWMRRCEPETPMFTDDNPDIQGWTYIADYSIHPLTPTHSGPHEYYIHARIRHDNRLQFGVFAEQYNGEHQVQLPLFSVYENEDECLIQTQLLHGDIIPPLRIAGKQESEDMLLHNGKLKLAAAPKLIGALMNVGNARITVTYGKTTTYFLKTYYGHIWVYWGAIIDRVFYMVGIPLFRESTRGTIVFSPNTEGAGSRISVRLPPTEDDLRSHFGGSVFVSQDCTLSPPKTAFYQAVKLIWGVSDSYHGGFESTRINVERFLEKYGDKEAPVTLCKRALAQVKQYDDSDNQLILSQVYHGDIYGDCSLLGYDGGVYLDKSGLLIRNEEDVSTSYVYPDTEGGWPSESGASGFIPTMTRYDRLGHIYYAAQAFHVGQVGRNYFIRTVGCLRPYGSYDMNSTLGGVDVSLTRSKEPEEEEEEEEPYWEPGGGGGGSGGSGGGGGGGGGGSSVEDVGDVGIWWQAGDGVKVTARRDTNATKIRYSFEVEVTTKFAYTQTLYYEVKPKFSVADGNSYTVDNGKVTLSMWYYLQGGTQVTVCNLTSKSNKGGQWVDNTHPESAKDFSLTGLRRVRSVSNFPVRYLTNYADPNVVNQSNILQLVNTGKTKKVTVSIVYYDSKNRKHRKRVKGTMKIYTIALRKANIKQILRNYPRLHPPAISCSYSPQSISGSTTGTAGAPTVKCDSVSVKPVQLPVQGETEVKGSYPMQVTGYCEEMTTKFSIVNACTGWYEVEPSNRHSVTISGSFSINSPFQRF